MKKIDIDNRIRTAVTHSTPDVLDSILAECDKQKGVVTQMITKKEPRGNWMKSFSAIAVACVVVIGIGFYNIAGINAVDSIISVDVNPSLEIKINKKEKVIEVNALNEDGRTVIGNMVFKNTNLEVAVNALIGSMLKNGYIDNIKNSILISVESKNDTKGVALQSKLGDEINKLLSASSINGAIVSQTIVDDDDLKLLANQNHITRGKAQLILQLVKANTSYKFEELAKLSVNELNLLVESSKIELTNASLAGKASDKEYIGANQAAKIAMNHAKVNASVVTNLEVELEFDDGKMVYEVEFDSNANEYKYDIDAKEGTIISFEQDDDDDDNRSGDNGTVVIPKTTTSITTSQKTSQTESSRMSAAQARRAVIDKFGGIIQKIEYNYNESNPLYKGEALKNGRKVVFELNARTQVFNKWDSSNDNRWDSFSHAIPAMITMDEAANIVISKSGKSDTFVQKIDFLWDDSEPMYQGEAFNRGVKYSFEIFAYSGKFQKWDSSTGDETWKEKYYNVK